MSDETAEKFDIWAIVEVMGHRKFAGHVTEQALAGAMFVRVDVPETATSAAFSKLIGAASIYCITPTTEEIARRAAGALGNTEAMPVYIPQERQLAASFGGDDDDDDGEDLWTSDEKPDA